MSTTAKRRNNQESSDLEESMRIILDSRSSSEKVLERVGKHWKGFCFNCQGLLAKKEVLKKEGRIEAIQNNETFKKALVLEERLKGFFREISRRRKNKNIRSLLIINNQVPFIQWIKELREHLTALKRVT